MARRLVTEHTPDLIGAWCEYGKRQPVGPGLVVNGVRSGEPPPGAPAPGELPASTWEIERWLRAKLPDVCDEHGRPHDAAVLAVRRIHFRHGRGSVTVRAYGAVIRAAVKAAQRDGGTRGEGSGQGE